MDSIPLAAPDGTICAWMCGKCRHVRAVGESLLPYSNEDVAERARAMKRQADECCKCRYCGAFVEMGSYFNDPVIEGEPRRYNDCCLACWPAQVIKIKQLHEEFAVQQKADDDAFEESLKKAKDYQAARRLEYTMREISEESYCAGWNSGLEYTLWRAVVTSNPILYGLAMITPDSIRELSDLSEKAGGWWTYRRFVTFEEWAAIYAAHETEVAKWQEEADKAKARSDG